MARLFHSTASEPSGGRAEQVKISKFVTDTVIRALCTANERGEGGGEVQQPRELPRVAQVFHGAVADGDGVVVVRGSYWDIMGRFHRSHIGILLVLFDSGERIGIL